MNLLVVVFLLHCASLHTESKVDPSLLFLFYQVVLQEVFPLIKCDNSSRSVVTNRNQLEVSQLIIDKVHLAHIIDRVTEEEGYPDSNEGRSEPPKILRPELVLRHFAGDLSEKELTIVIVACIFDGLHATHRDVSFAISLAVAKLKDLFRECGPVKVCHLRVFRYHGQVIIAIRQETHVQTGIAGKTNIDHTDTEDFFDTESDLALEEESGWLVRL